MKKRDPVDCCGVSAPLGRNMASDEEVAQADRVAEEAPGSEAGVLGHLTPL